MSDFLHTQGRLEPLFNKDSSTPEEASYVAAAGIGIKAKRAPRRRARPCDVAAAGIGIKAKLQTGNQAPANHVAAAGIGIKAKQRIKH